VLNSFGNGSWGKEERVKLPFKKGDPFDVRVRVHVDKFEIFCDRKEIKDFHFRLPLTSITHMSIEGDISVSNVHWGGKYYPVPYESGIGHNGLGPGKSLIIYGTPDKKAKQFAVNLLKKNGDMALHFNARLEQKAVVRNACIGGAWGNEEKEGKIPFEKTIGFDLKIVNESYGFQIFVNNVRFCTFAHRSDPNDINGLQVSGDVELSGIQIS